MLIKNVSPLGDLEVVALGRVVKRGEEVEVTDQSLAASLLRQRHFEAVEKQANREVAKEAVKGGKASK